MAEWRVYIEGCKSITVITDHTTLQHLPKTNDAEKMAKVPRIMVECIVPIFSYQS